jgi:hypothetical protein
MTLLVWCWPHPSPCYPWTHHFDPTQICDTQQAKDDVVTSELLLVWYTLLMVLSFTLDEGALGLEDTLDLQGISITRPYNWWLRCPLYIGTYLSLRWWCLSLPSGPHGLLVFSYVKLPHSASAPSSPPISSITLKIQLKGETAQWNNVLRKAANTQTPQLPYIVMMATCRQTVTMDRNPPPYHQ